MYYFPEAIGPRKVYTIFNKRLIGNFSMIIEFGIHSILFLVFGRKRVRVADLNDLTANNVQELSFRVLDISSPLGVTDESSVGETYFCKEMFRPTVYSFL